jgi:hypothetical protein
MRFASKAHNYYLDVIAESLFLKIMETSVNFPWYFEILYLNKMFSFVDELLLTNFQETKIGRTNKARPPPPRSFSEHITPRLLTN